MFTPLGLDHVVFRVKDQAASQRFYVDQLGCTVDHVNERISLVHLRFGEHYIDLLRRGVVIEGEVAQRRGAYGTGPSIYIRDPDGHIVELKPRA
jgi:catechol 2,3-dioxygenase-like lactoylglutathione lyase family enzyme